MIKHTVLHFLRGYLALLLGVVILSVPMYSGTIALFEKRQLALTSESMQSGLNQLDQQISALIGISFSVGSEARYRTFASRSLDDFSLSDYYNLHKLQVELRRLCLSQPYVIDYGLLMKNKILFTKERTHFPNENYYGTFLRFGDMDQETFYETFGSPGALSRFLPQMQVDMMYGSEEVMNTYTAVTWLCSISQTLSSQPSGVFYATISDTTMAKLLMPDLQREDAGFILTDKKGEEILRYGLTREEDANALSLKSAVTQSGLQVTLYLSDTLFSGMLMPIRNLLLLSLGGLVLVGLVLSAGLAIRASKPVRRLMTLVSQTEDATTYHDGAKNSFEVIGNAMTGLLTSVDEYRDALAAQQMSVREHVFETMLRETPLQEASASRRHIQEFSQCFPNFPPRYRLALIQIKDLHEKETVEELPRRRVMFRSLVETQLLPTPYILFSGWNIILALDATQEANWKGQLTTFRRMVRERFETPTDIALSDESATFEELHMLFQQTQSILNLAGNEKQEGLVEVWQKHNFPDQQYAFPLNYSEMSQLHDLLLGAEKEAALSMLCSLRHQLRPISFMDEIMIRQVFYNLRSVLLRVKMERYEVLVSLDVPDWHGELSNDRLFETLEGCCVTICDALAPLVKSRHTAFSVAVCRFIDNHLGDSALGARMVADYYGISEPTLQKVIRQEKGCSFFDYVEQGRYQLAVSLLTGTNVPISQVAAQCGFNSPNSFYKAFKRMSALPPAAVRQAAKAKRDD